MPIYEYQCKNCKFKFEKLQKVTDDPLTNCPKCGQDELYKLISAAGFQLKGSGWYVTDFKDKKAKSKENKAEKPAEKTKDTKNKDKD